MKSVIGKYFVVCLMILGWSISEMAYSNMRIPGKSTVQSDCYIYVSVSKEKKITVFRLDEAKGALIFIKDIELSGEPGSLCIDPDKKYIYAALRSTKSIAGLLIDHETGILTPLKDTPVADNPVYLSTAGAGKFILFTSYSGNKNAVYRVDEGIVDPDPVFIAEARVNPHMIETDPRGKYVFVPNLGGNLVQEFIFKQDGSLVPNQPGEIQAGDGRGPRHFTFHPGTDIFYLVNEIACTVMMFRYDKRKGILSGPVQELTTLPAGFTASNTCADIHVTPDGKFIYASNRGDNSIAAFSIHPKTSLLTSVGHYPTEKTPREFEIDPSGKFLVSAGEGSGNLALYSIRKDGSLMQLNTCEAGQWPVWVLSAQYQSRR